MEFYQIKHYRLYIISLNQTGRPIQSPLPSNQTRTNSSLSCIRPSRSKRNTIIYLALLQYHQRKIKRKQQALTIEFTIFGQPRCTFTKNRIGTWRNYQIICFKKNSYPSFWFSNRIEARRRSLCSFTSKLLFYLLN